MITPEAFASLVHRMAAGPTLKVSMSTPACGPARPSAGWCRLERDVDRFLEHLLPPPITRSPLPGRSSSSHDQETPDA